MDEKDNISPIKLHKSLCKQARSIMEGKNHDYRGGTGDPFANFRGSSSFDIHPIVGILLRMQDKMMRIKTYVEKGKLTSHDDSLDDAFLDIINYTVLAYGMVEEERFPTKEETRVLKNEEHHGPKCKCDRCAKEEGYIDWDSLSSCADNSMPCLFKDSHGKVTPKMCGCTLCAALEAQKWREEEQKRLEKGDD